MLARISRSDATSPESGSTSSVINVAKISTTIEAGSSLRARFAQNAGSAMRPVRDNSRASCPVIRYPEITKKISTPMYPPLSRPG